MSPKRSSKTGRGGVTPPARAKAHAKAPKAAPTKRSKALGVVLILLVLAGLLGQAGWSFYRNRKTQVTLHFDGAIAPRGPGKGQVTGARHMAANAKGELFYLQGGADSMVLQKFARDGRWLGWVSPESPEAERLNNGFAVAAGNDGSVWVVEKGTGFLKQYGEDMRLKMKLQLPGSDLNGVAVGPDGRVWAADYSGQLLIADPKNGDIKRFQGEKKGRLRAPFRLAISGEGEVFVLDFANGMGKDPVIHAYDAQGKHLKSWTVKGQPVNEFMCIAWHPQGFVVLNDNRPDVVEAVGFRLFSPDGKLQGVATLTDTGQNIRAIPAFAISAGGDWFMDMTPLQQGCGRLTWAPSL